MKYVFILEDNLKFQNEIVEAIQQIDPKVGIRIFLNLDSFVSWLKIAASEGPKCISGAAEPSEQDELVMVVSKEEFLGSRWIGLLRKTRVWFIKKKICRSEDPTSLVITAFENPQFDIKLVEDRIINNVIYKPFDKLILNQHLNFALNGRHPPSNYSIYNMKMTSRIEMLKEIHVESISELGMVSRSNRPIEIGAVSKYYADYFTSSKHKSILAKCLSCFVHPDFPQEFQCTFSFFATDPEQISFLRKKVFQKKENASVYQWLKVSRPDEIKEVVIVEANQEYHGMYERFFKEYFTNTHITIYRTIGEVLHLLDPPKKSILEVVTSLEATALLPVLTPLPSRIDILIADEFAFQAKFADRWENIKNLVQTYNKGQSCHVFMISSKVYKGPEEREFAKICHDLFYKPFDTNYISKKMKMFLQELHTPENIKILTVFNTDVVKVANAIEVSELSEAGLVMSYYRPITIGTFREFVLWMPHELGLPEFLGSCNFVGEEKDSKGFFKNHFVFFGMSDAYLKHIRVWIRDNYIHSKEVS